MTGFNGAEFGAEVAALVKVALAQQKAETDLQIAALGERLARLEGTKAMPRHQPKPQPKRG